MVEKRNKAVAAAANRLARNILTTFLEEPGTALGRGQRGRLEDS
jgi:hypothetical protein